MANVIRAGGYVNDLDDPEHGWQLADGPVEVEVVEPSFDCDKCKFEGQSAQGLAAHQRVAHTGKKPAAKKTKKPAAKKKSSKK